MTSWREETTSGKGGGQGLRKRHGGLGLPRHHKRKGQNAPHGHCLQPFPGGHGEQTTISDNVMGKRINNLQPTFRMHCFTADFCYR